MFGDLKFEPINACLLCGSRESMAYYGRGAPGGMPTANCICCNCGLIYQNPRPDSASIAAFYARYMQQLQPDIIHLPPWFEENLMGIARLRLRYLRPFLSHGDRVLDIGCSYGVMLAVLRDEAGLDLSVCGVNPEAAVAAFARNRYGLPVHVAMIEDVDLADGSIDVAILDNVIEHFADPRAVVAKIHRLLAPGGRLFIATNNAYEPHGFLWQNFFLDHTATFSPRTLTALLRSEGWRPLDVDTTGNVTCEGYHYPYIQAVFRKETRPERFDYAAHGDDPQAMANMARAYARRFYRQHALRKRAYELSVYPGQTLRNRVEAVAVKALRWLIGDTTDHKIFNHTLPPEEFVWRRILLAVCATDADVALLNRLTAATDLAPKAFIYQQAPVTTNGSALFCVAPLENAPALASGLPALARWLTTRYPRIDELIVVRLEDVWMPADALAASHQDMRRSGATVKQVVFDGDGRADWIIACGDDAAALLRRLSAAVGDGHEIFIATSAAPASDARDRASERQSPCRA